MSDKPRIKDLKCFKQVASVLGESQAQLELFKVVNDYGCRFNDEDYIISAFNWSDSPQGWEFWKSVFRRSCK